MGYNTKFTGKFQFNKPLESKHKELFLQIYNERHNDNCLPSKHCQWMVDKSGTKLIYDGNEKFYGYIEWIGIIKLLAELLGYELTGKAFWRGESKNDVGTIKIKNRKVKIWKAGKKQAFEPGTSPF
jgi:hypothetical protein